MAKNKDRMTRAEKRKLEMERRHERNVTYLKEGLAIIAILAVVAVVVLFLMKGGASGPAASQSIAPTGSNEVKVPVADLGTQAKFYDYNVNGTKVRFFAMNGSDGTVRVATDACDVCYSLHKGYHQDGSDMVCNNCGKRFSVASIGTSNTAGGCWPSFLKMHVDGGNVVVEGKDLAAKAYMFN